MRMRTCILFLPLLFSSVFCDLTKVYNGVGELSWKLLGKTYENGKNTVHSSMSISKALAMCLAGADGETLKVMQSTMGLGNVSIEQILQAYKDDSQAVQKLQTSTKSFTLNEANRLYLNSSFETNDLFVKTVREVFQADAKRVNFRANPDPVRGEINKFVADATKNLIPEILSNPLDSETMFAIVNALYFKSTWLFNMTLDKENTQKFNDFQCSALTPSKVSWLSLRSSLRYAESKTLSAQIVEVPYVSDHQLGIYASMVFILPHESKKCDLASWLKSLSWNGVRSAIEEVSSNPVILKLPEVDIESKFELAGALKELGMNLAFSNRANFVKMIKPGSRDRVKIDKVIHQAKLKVDKQGTEAAAATVISGVRTTSLGAPKRTPVTVTLNRSFVSIIILRRKNTIVPLFTAVVNSPK